MAEATETVETEPAEPAAIEAREPAAPAESEREPQTREPAPAEPQPFARQQMPLQPTPLQADEVEAGIDQAITAVDQDDMLTPGQKAAQRATLLAQKATYRGDREDRQYRQLDRQRQTANDTWDFQAAQHGIGRGTLEQLWQQSYAERSRLMPGADPLVVHGAAIATYEQKVAEAKRSSANNTDERESTAPQRRPVGSTRAIPRGSRPAPALPEKKLTVAQYLEQGKLPPGYTEEGVNADLA